jgi:uncharacterized protein YutE (UPF0331/DUF86 family)
MDKLILYSKLDSLKRCIDRIKKKTPDSLEALRSDLDRQDIIVLNLERAVQVCVDMAAYIIAEQDVQTPMSMAESFESLHKIKIIDQKLMERMKKSVPGIRTTNNKMVGKRVRLSNHFLIPNPDPGSSGFSI